MRTRIRQKWRPPLALILGGVLGSVLCLPIIGFLLLRSLGPMMGWVQAFGILSLVILSVTLLLGWLLWRLIVRPVNGLVDRATRLKTGDRIAAQPMEHYGTPELQRLGQSMMDMAAALQNRADGLRQYSDHVTHELKSPLTTLQGASEMLRHAQSPEEVSQLSDLVGQSTDRMTHLLNSMRQLAAARAPLEGPDTPLSEIDWTTVDIKVELAQDGVIPMSKPALQMVMEHLLRNAAEHGASLVKVGWHKDTLTFSDNGRGIASGNQTRIFEPFFTTKRDAGGTGMGLAIVSGVVQGQGGQISVLPSEIGTTFVIRF